MTVVVIGMAVLFAGLPADESDVFDASLGYRTMFANLFATLPFLLFDRQVHQERTAPLPLEGAVLTLSPRSGGRSVDVRGLGDG